MRSPRLQIPILLLGALALAHWLQPRAHSFELLGGRLGVEERHFFVHDNFADVTASDNTTPHPHFPGQAGATLAFWKAGAEWGSELRVDGSGDPSQPNDLGSGGANFDFYFAGRVSGPGGIDSNTASAISGGMGSALAFMEAGPGGVSDGWRIRFIESWTWDDGPGASVIGFDLQGVMCHELGHALGLDHSTIFGSTMTAVVLGSGVAARSLHADDRLGVQAIYGPRSALKPHLESAKLCGNQVVLRGRGFAATNNEVRMTRGGIVGATPLVLSNLPSSLGGIELRFGLPIAAGPGDVTIRVPSGPAGLAFGEQFSNAVGFEPSSQNCGTGLVSYCTGESRLGCPGCPCGNDSDVGSGEGCLNATGRGARLLASGSASLSGMSLRFTVDRAPPQSFVLLVSGMDTLPAAGTIAGCPGGSGLPAQTENGLRCIGGSVLRHGIQLVGPTGETLEPWGGPGGLLAGLGGLSVGEERHFQAFYREPAGAVCGTGLNATQAVRALILP